MNDQNIEVLKVEIAKLDLNPGDVLVVKIDVPEITTIQAECVHRNLSALGFKVLILDGKTDISVLTKAEIEARAQCA